MRTTIPAVIILLFCFNCFLTAAQSIVDAWTTGKGNLNVALSGSYEKYDEFWVKDVPVATSNPFIVQSASAYGSLGINKYVDFILNVPYVRLSTGASALSNFQDAAAHISVECWSKFFSNGSRFSVTGAVGLQIPLSNYDGTTIISIGQHATQGQIHALLHYKMNSGLFFTATGGYHDKSNPSPNAMIGQFNMGLAKSKYFVQALLVYQNSIGGKDLPCDPAYPPCDNFQLVGSDFYKLSGNIYVPVWKKLGVSGGGSYILDGRNVGHAWGVFGSVVYGFKNMFGSAD